MASWCWICHRKVDASYRYYKGDKAHRKCIENQKRSSEATMVVKKISKAEPKEKKPKAVYMKPPRPKVKDIILPGPQDLNEPSSDFSKYTCLIYGGKAVGKTTASASFPGNLNIQFEPRRRNVALRMYPINVARAKEITCDEDDPWVEFVSVCAAAIEDKTIKTITIDTIDLAYETCQEHICFRNQIDYPGDKNDRGAAWNDLKHTFTSLLQTLGESGKTLLLLSHSKERDQSFLDIGGAKDVETLVGPSCSPACLKILKQTCDFWFYYGKSGERRVLTMRDINEPRILDVAVGCGFVTPDGETINSIEIPSDPAKFYPVLNDAFQGRIARPKKVVRKLTK